MKLLRDSGFDLKQTFTTDSFGTRLDNEARSEMSRLMSKQGLEKKIAKLLNNDQVKQELQMYRDQRLYKQRSGKSPTKVDNFDISKSFTHTQLRKIFSDAKKTAEQQMHGDRPELYQQGVVRDALEQAQKSLNLDRVEQLLNMLK